MDTDAADKSWWDFALDPAARTAHFAGADPAQSHVAQDYRSYLRLDDVLHAQQPTSPVPDERVFIITHQLFELTFKQMIFDLGVIATTIERIMQDATTPTETFRASTENADFWQPALTAASRMKYACKEMMPVLIGLLGTRDEQDDTFSGAEFHRFRANLIPSSGFQTAQFRLIQRALGKSNLFAIRLFPASEYWQQYEQSAGVPVVVVDPLILRADAAVASPPATNEPLARVARLDDLIHSLLSKLPVLGDDEPVTLAVEQIDARQTAHIEEVFATILANQRKASGQPDTQGQDAMAQATLHGDLRAAVNAENERRHALRAARSGMLYLHAVAPASSLLKVIQRLIAADNALHSEQGDDSFLARHMKMAVDRLTEVQEAAAAHGDPLPPNGTGGGGVEYLGYMRKLLIPLFPALVACRRLQGAPVTLSGLAFQ